MKRWTVQNLGQLVTRVCFNNPKLYWMYSVLKLRELERHAHDWAYPECTECAF